MRHGDSSFQNRVQSEFQSCDKPPKVRSVKQYSNILFCLKIERCFLKQIPYIQHTLIIIILNSISVLFLLYFHLHHPFWSQTKKWQRFKTSLILFYQNMCCHTFSYFGYCRATNGLFIIYYSFQYGFKKVYSRYSLFRVYEVLLIILKVNMTVLTVTEWICV